MDAEEYSEEVEGEEAEGEDREVPLGRPAAALLGAAQALSSAAVVPKAPGTAASTADGSAPAPSQCQQDADIKASDGVKKSGPAAGAATPAAAAAATAAAAKKKKKPLPPIRINLSNCKYEVLRIVQRKLGWREVGDDEDWELYWTDTSVGIERIMKLNKIQKINHFCGMLEICRKRPMARNLQKMAKLYPQLYDFFPKTFILPSDREELMADVRARGKKQVYIFKPDAGCQGRGIRLLQGGKEEAVAKVLSEMATPNIVAQHYLPQPLLIHGYKFDLRIYALVLSCDPLRVFLFYEGLARFCTEKYKPPKASNLEVAFMHLTNYAVNKKNEAFVAAQNAGAGAAAGAGGGAGGGDDEGEDASKWTLAQLRQYLNSHGHDYDKVWADIADLIIKSLCSVHPILRNNYRSVLPPDNDGFSCFEILGYDVMLDSTLRPWLIEVNHSPSFNIDSPLDLAIKEELITQTIELARIDPKLIAKSKKAEKKAAASRLLEPMHVRKPAPGAGPTAPAAPPPPAAAATVGDSAATSGQQGGGGSAAGGGDDAPATPASSGVPSASAASTPSTPSGWVGGKPKTAEEYEAWRAEVLRAREKYEAKHSGGYTRIYPSPDPKKQALYEELLKASMEVFQAAFQARNKGLDRGDEKKKKEEMETEAQKAERAKQRAWRDKLAQQAVERRKTKQAQQAAAAAQQQQQMALPSYLNPPPYLGTAGLPHPLPQSQQQWDQFAFGIGLSGQQVPGMQPTAPMGMYAGGGGGAAAAAAAAAAMGMMHSPHAEVCGEDDGYVSAGSSRPGSGRNYGHGLPEAAVAGAGYYQWNSAGQLVAGSGQVPASRVGPTAQRLSMRAASPMSPQRAGAAAAAAAAAAPGAAPGAASDGYAPTLYPQQQAMLHPTSQPNYQQGALPPQPFLGVPPRPASATPAAASGGRGGPVAPAAPPAAAATEPLDAAQHQHVFGAGDAGSGYAPGAAAAPAVAAAQRFSQAGSQPAGASWQLQQHLPYGAGLGPVAAGSAHHLLRANLSPAAAAAAAAVAAAATAAGQQPQRHAAGAAGAAAAGAAAAAGPVPGGSSSVGPGGGAAGGPAAGAAAAAAAAAIASGSRGAYYHGSGWGEQPAGARLSSAVGAAGPAGSGGAAAGGVSALGGGRPNSATAPPASLLIKLQPATGSSISSRELALHIEGRPAAGAETSGLPVAGGPGAGSSGPQPASRPSSAGLRSARGPAAAGGAAAAGTAGAFGGGGGLGGSAAAAGRKQPAPLSQVSLNGGDAAVAAVAASWDQLLSAGGSLSPAALAAAAHEAGLLQYYLQQRPRPMSAGGHGSGGAAGAGLQRMPSARRSPSPLASATAYHGVTAAAGSGGATVLSQQQQQERLLYDPGGRGPTTAASIARTLSNASAAAGVPPPLSPRGGSAAPMPAAGSLSSGPATWDAPGYPHGHGHAHAGAYYGSGSGPGSPAGLQAGGAPPGSAGKAFRTMRSMSNPSHQHLAVRAAAAVAANAAAATAGGGAAPGPYQNGPTSADSAVYGEAAEGGGGYQYVYAHPTFRPLEGPHTPPHNHSPAQRASARGAAGAVPPPVALPQQRQRSFTSGPSGSIGSTIAAAAAAAAAAASGSPPAARVPSASPFGSAGQSATSTSGGMVVPAKQLVLPLTIGGTSTGIGTVTRVGSAARISSNGAAAGTSMRATQHASSSAIAAAAAGSAAASRTISSGRPNGAAAPASGGAPGGIAAGMVSISSLQGIDAGSVNGIGGDTPMAVSAFGPHAEGELLVRYNLMAALNRKALSVTGKKVAQ